MARLKRRHLWIPGLAMSAALPAAAVAGDADCTTPHYVWELELDTLEKLDDGPGDLAAERAALGETALLRGDALYPDHPSYPANVWLEGPEDAANFWSYSFEGEP